MRRAFFLGKYAFCFLSCWLAAIFTLCFSTYFGPAKFSRNSFFAVVLCFPAFGALFWGFLGRLWRRVGLPLGSPGLLGPWGSFLLIFFVAACASKMATEILSKRTKTNGFGIISVPKAVRRNP